jgi:hypothetical protein
MADGVFNIAKGRAAYYATLPATNDALVLVLFKTVLDADSALVDRTTLAAITGAGNVEADFTNYARKTLTSVTVTVDNTNDRVDVDIADQTWTAAGGTANNTLAKLIIGYDPDTTGGADSDIIPLTHHDFVTTTDGSDLLAQIATSGFYRAS